MKRFHLSIIVALCLSFSFAQQPALVVGQHQNMMFTDIAPDRNYTCNWPINGHTCNQYSYYDVNHDGTNDFYVFHAYVECNLNSFRIWQLQPLTNVEFLVDSLGVTPFSSGDTIAEGLNVVNEFIYSLVNYDSLGNPVYDTTFLLREAQWLDTTDHSYMARLIAHTGGGGSLGCSGEANWAHNLIDTNYFAFRLIDNADTTYGWFKTYSNDNVYFNLSGESFAVSGDTGNFVYTNLETMLTGSEVRVFPNPVSDKLIVELPDQQYAVEVVSLDGRILKREQKLKGESIDVHDLATGYYLLGIVSNERRITRSFVKN